MKTLFTFQVQSFTDVITNSSSELFVYNETTTRNVENLLNSTVPGWEDEYESPKSLNELTSDELELYMDYAYDRYDWSRYGTRITRENSNQTRWAKEFNINPYLLYENYGEWDPSSNDWRISTLHLKEGWDKYIKEKLPKNLVFVFSMGENPDWDRQEIMRDYGTRYHLG